MVGGVAPASAATNPSATFITVRCGVLGAVKPGDSACDSLDLDAKSKNGSILDGSVEVLSGGVVVATELNPQIFVRHDAYDQGTVTVVATGNNNAVLFDAWYAASASSVLNAPDVQVKVWVNKAGKKTLAIHQGFAPEGAALWAAHSGDTDAEVTRAKAAEAALQAAISAGDSTLGKSLTAETNRAQLAEATLQGALTSEVASRQADTLAASMAVINEATTRSNGDAALQNQININAANLQIALNAETTRALAAESAEKSRSQAADTTLQLNIDGEVAARKQGDADTLTSAKSYSDGKLAGESAARLAADAALTTSVNNEVTRARQVESSLRAAIDAEVVRSQTAEFNIRTDLSNETARALAAEAALQAGQNGNVAALQAALNAEIAARKQGDVDTLASANVYTDAKVATEAAARAAADNAEANTRAAADVAEANTRAAADVAEVAARKQGDADALAAAKLYTDQQTANEAAARTAADNALDAALNAESTRAKAAELAEAMRASGAESILDAALNAEAARAKAAEMGLTAGLNNEAARAQGAEAALTAGLNSEAARAKAAEATLATDLTNEVARAKGAEATLTTDLTNEVARAKGAEATLTTDLANEVGRAKAAETAESNRAAAAEAALQAALNNEAARALAAEATLTTDLANEVARAKAAEALADANGGAEAARAKAAELALQMSLDAEVTRAKNAEAVLTAAVNSESARALAAEATLTAAVNSETARAKAAETALQLGLDTETTRAKAAETTLAGDLAAEAARAKGAEAGLSMDVATETARAKAAESAEANRATAAEATLTAAVNSEVARAQGAEATITATVNSEVARAKAAEATELGRASAAEAALTNGLNSEVTRAKATESGLATDVTNEAAARLAGDNANAAALSAYQAQLKAPGVLNAANNPLDWTELKNVPAGAAQGYQAGTGITITGTIIDNVGVVTINGQAASASAFSLKAGPGMSATSAPGQVTYALELDAAGGLTTANSKLGVATAGITSAMLLDGTIVAADISANAAISDGQLKDDITAGRIQNLANAPACDNTKTGVVYYNTANNTVFFCNGVQFAAFPLATDLQAEIAARIAGDASTLASANAHSDQLFVTASLATAGEQAARQAADNALQMSIDAETTRAKAAETTLTTNLNSEVTRATAAEATLTTSINNEVARATGAEATLTTSINNEVTRATTAEAGKANLALNNLAGVAINTSLLPGAANSLNLGSGAKTWKTLFVTNNGTATAGVDFQPSGGGLDTLLQAAPASVARTIILPNASGTVAVSASGNIALDAAGNVTFTGTLPIANGGTNNTTFASGKFLAFDGTKVASTTYDQTSFAASNASLTVNAGAGLAGGGVVPLGGAVTLSIPVGGVSNAMLQSSSITVTPGTGLSGGGAVALGGAVTLNNAGVVSLAGGGGVSVSAATGAIAITTAGGGDVSGPLSGLAVTGLQGRSVANVAPANGQVLAWNGASWSPTSAVAGNLTGTGAANTLAKWTAGTALGNSVITDTGTAVTIAPVSSTTFSSGTVIAQSGVVARGGISNDGGALTLGASNSHINHTVQFLDMNGRNAIQDSADGWLRLNQSGSYGSGTYTPGFLRADGGITSGGAGSLGGGTVLATAQIQSPIYYDYNDTSYFLDANSTSRLNNLRFNTADCLNGFCPQNGAVRFTPNMHLNANSGNAVIINWDNGSLPGNNTQQLRIGNGQGGDAFYFTSAGYGIGAYINTSDNVIGSGVTGIMAKQGDNYHRTANASAVANFARQACGNSNPGPSCGSYHNLGNAGWGYAATFSDALPNGGSNEHWYRVTFTTSGGGNTGAYHPHVYLNGGQAYYTVDVFADDCATKLSCEVEGGGKVSVQLDNWEVNMVDVGVGDLSNASGTASLPAPGAGGSVRIRVRPYTDTVGAGCAGYSLVVRNDGN